MMVTPVAKVPSALRKSRGSIAEVIAGEFGGGIRIGRMLGFVIHPLISERQVFGWQAKRDAAVIGAGRIEIESQMRIDRVGVAKLALQCAAHV